MPSEPAVDPELMYDTWIACHRNASEAARKLGMQPSNFQRHVRVKNFDERYAADFSGASRSIARIAVMDVLNQWPALLKNMVDIALHAERTSDQIAAFRELKGYVPENIMDASSEELKYIEAYVVVEDEFGEDDGVTKSALEDQVRGMLEANIVEAVEERTKTKGRAK